MAANPGQANCKLVAVIAARLRSWRSTRRIPLKQMAADLGVSIATISAWENGRRCPTIEHIAMLSRYTGIPACHLLYDGPGDCPIHQSHIASLPISTLGRKKEPRSGEHLLARSPPFLLNCSRSPAGVVCQQKGGKSNAQELSS
jgi:transcriptional regulator with XRE-family HTH domain